MDLIFNRSRDDIRQNILFGLFILAMLALIFPVKIANVVFSISVLVCLLLYSRNGLQSIYSNRLTRYTILFFLFEMVGLLYTDKENLRLGFSELEKHLPFLFMPFLFINFKVSSRRYDFIVSAFVVGGLVAAIICTYANLKLSLVEGKYFHEYYFSYERISEPIGLQAVYFALYLSFCVLILLDMLKIRLQGSNRLVKAALILLLGYFVLMVVASGARTVTVALMILIFLNFVIYAIQRRTFKFAILATLVPVIFVALIFLNPVVFSRFIDLTYNTTIGTKYDSYFARTGIWKSGFDVLRENFWFGVGVGDQEPELVKKYQQNNYLAGVEFKYNMHNQYMQTILGTGIFGLIILAMMVLTQVKLAIQNQDMLYVSFMLLFLLSCLTESMLNRNKGILFFLFFGFLFFKKNMDDQRVRTFIKKDQM